MILVENRDFFIPLAFDAPVREDPVRRLPPRLVWEIRMVGLPANVKTLKIMCNRLNSIPACDRRTDRQRSCYGIVRAMHTRRAVIKRQQLQ